MFVYKAPYRKHKIGILIGSITFLLRTYSINKSEKFEINKLLLITKLFSYLLVVHHIQNEWIRSQI